MQAAKIRFVAIGAVLASGLLLSSCERGNVNTQTGALELTVTTEDGSGDDMDITTAVNIAMLADPLLQHSAIQIETRKGDVKLYGWVDTPSQRAQAELVAAATSGVHAVNNQLEIKQNKPLTPAGRWR